MKEKTTQNWTQLLSTAKTMNYVKKFEYAKQLLGQISKIQHINDVNHKHRLLHTFAFTFNNILAAKRKALSQLNQLQHDNQSQESMISEQVNELKNMIVKDSQQFIQIIQRLSRVIIKPDKSEEGQLEIQKIVFCEKMVADYKRYILKYKSLPVQQYNKQANKIDNHYDNALDESRKIKDKYNEIKLGLILNYSVFIFEFQNSPEKAMKMYSRYAHEMSQDSLQQLIDTNAIGPEAKKTLQSMKSNYDLWKQNYS